MLKAYPWGDGRQQVRGTISLEWAIIEILVNCPLTDSSGAKQPFSSFRFVPQLIMHPLSSAVHHYNTRLFYSLHKNLQNNRPKESVGRAVDSSSKSKYETT